MSKIQVLDPITIDKIAAGEVIERPASVVKELVENAIDAGATAIVVEIKEGGISFMRITDNGCGIERDDVRSAFLRHSTSKIRSVDDLVHIGSLGFRGEALSSISAVAQVELITKTRDQTFGTLYRIAGGKEEDLEDTGAPDGTTFIIRQLFYNTPARRKFLKTPMTEASHVGDLMTRLALSHPHISFQFINNGQSKLHTSGNGKLKDVIYHIYGRDIAANLLKAEYDAKGLKVTGFLGKPIISRGNRNFENYYVNGRYVKSKIVTKAVEDAYHTFMMQHKYPFTCLHIQIKGSDVDVNVHPTKMEVRFSDQELIYRQIYQTIIQGLQHKELIPQVTIGKDRLAVRPANRDKAPEPFEVQRRQIEQPRGYQMQQKVQPEELKKRAKAANPIADRTVAVAASGEETHKGSVVREQGTGCYGEKRETGYRNENPAKQNPNLQAGQVVSDRRDNIAAPGVQKAEQMDLFDGKLLSPEAKKHHKIIGQVFDTYWLVQMEDKLYIIDQHAAHEKVLYERIVKEMKERNVSSQIVSPPIIISLNLEEQEKMKKYQNIFKTLGFEIESFGGREYSIRAVPQNLFGMTEQGFFIEVLDHLEEDPSSKTLDVLSDRMATMACKAAVKGNQKLSLRETEALIDELLQLENPYNCPHGRPTIISMSKYELEKKFKRIV